MTTCRFRAALRCAARGVAVFPLAPGSKAPLAGSHGLRDATTDAATIERWWRDDPARNIAAATGPAGAARGASGRGPCDGFWVLDVDQQHDGPASLAKLESEHGPLPPTVESATPSGGRHLYWRWPEAGPAIRCSASRIGRGLDVKGAGGSIVLPPSVRRDGRAYCWVRNGATLADAPAWLVTLAAPPPPPAQRAPKPLSGDMSNYVAAAAANELAALEAAGEGQRNAMLNKAAYALAGFVLAGALPDDWTRAQLESRALSIGLGRREVQNTIASAFAAAEPRELAT